MAFPYSDLPNTSSSSTAATKLWKLPEVGPCTSASFLKLPTARAILSAVKSPHPITVEAPACFMAQLDSLDEDAVVMRVVNCAQVILQKDPCKTAEAQRLFDCKVDDLFLNIRCFPLNYRDLYILYLGRITSFIPRYLDLEPELIAELNKIQRLCGRLYQDILKNEQLLAKFDSKSSKDQQEIRDRSNQFQKTVRGSFQRVNEHLESALAKSTLPKAKKRALQLNVLRCANTLEGILSIFCSVDTNRKVMEVHRRLVEETDEPHKAHSCQVYAELFSKEQQFLFNLLDLRKRGLGEGKYIFEGVKHLLNEFEVELGRYKIDSSSGKGRRERMLTKLLSKKYVAVSSQLKKVRKALVSALARTWENLESFDRVSLIQHRHDLCDTSSTMSAEKATAMRKLAKRTKEQAQTYFIPSETAWEDLEAAYDTFLESFFNYLADYYDTPCHPRDDEFGRNLAAHLKKLYQYREKVIEPKVEVMAGFFTKEETEWMSIVKKAHSMDSIQNSDYRMLCISRWTTDFLKLADLSMSRLAWYIQEAAKKHRADSCVGVEESKSSEA